MAKRKINDLLDSYIQRVYKDPLDYKKLQNPGQMMKIGKDQFVGYQPPKTKKGETYTMVGQRDFYRAPGGAGDGNKGGAGAGTAYIPIWQKAGNAQAKAPKADNTTQQAPQPYSPTELQINEPATTAPDPTAAPIPEPMRYAPGGASLMIGGNATNLRRKYSQARLSGNATRGTSQFRVNNTGISSSLNIGV